VYDFNDFIITTGASTPVDINTAEGSKLQQRYDMFAKELASDKVDVKERRQYVTDLYKICLHEDITATVSSAVLPFGKQALKARIPTSDSHHLLFNVL
jgi:hypothetical protein